MEYFRSQVSGKDELALTTTIGTYTFNKSKEHIVDHMLERHFGINWEYFYYRDDKSGKTFARSIFISDDLDRATGGIIKKAISLAKETGRHQIFREDYLQLLVTSINSVYSKIDTFLKKPRKNESVIRDSSKTCPEIFQNIGDSKRQLRQAITLCEKMNKGLFKTVINNISKSLTEAEKIISNNLLDWIMNFSQTANSMLSEPIPVDTLKLPKVEDMKNHLENLAQIKENLSQKILEYDTIIEQNKADTNTYYQQCKSDTLVKEFAEKLFIHSLSASTRSIETDESSGIISAKPQNITLDDLRVMLVSCLVPTTEEIDLGTDDRLTQSDEIILAITLPPGGIDFKSCFPIRK